jgi:PAS domain S-box-containing protein
MRHAHERIGSLLSQIIEIHKKLGPEDVHRELDERLEGQLSIMLQAMVADASKLNEVSLEEIAVTEQVVYVVRIFVIALTVIIAAMLLFIGRSIAIPLTRLHKGTEVIGSGNLVYRVGTDAKDEIGQLSRAFDSMTEKIIDSYETLKESEEKFRSFLATANDALVLINDEGKIEYWNRAAEKIFGYPAAEVLGGECHQLLSPMKYHEANSKGFAHFKESGEGPFLGKTLELTARRKDGTEFSVELSVSAVLLRGKWHAIGIVRDITERQQTAAQLTYYREHLEELVEERTAELTKEIIKRQQAEAKLKMTADELERSNRELQQFAYIVSHDLQEPM